MNTGILNRPETLLLAAVVAALTSAVPAPVHAALPSQYQNAPDGDAGEVPSQVWMASDGDDMEGNGSPLQPYATLNKALEGRLGDSPDTLYVNVCEGTYFLDRIIDISHAGRRPVVVRAESGRPRLVGGRKVTGWEKTDGGVYRTFIPEAFGGLDIGQFYVNGRRAVPARTPNEGFFKPEEFESYGFSPDGTGYSIGLYKVKCSPDVFGSIADVSISAGCAPNVKFLHKWNSSSYPVKSIEKDSCSFYAVCRSMTLWNRIDSTGRFFFYGFPQALDSPGEWYFDRAEGYLYYLPLPGEDMASAECIVPVLRLLMRIKGTGERHVCDMRFEGLSFECSSYLMPEGGIGPVQAAAFLPAAIELDYADNIVFHDCEICHTGAYALWIRDFCHGCEVSRCLVSDLGAGGIKLGGFTFAGEGSEVTGGNVLDNNIISHGGYEFPCGVGVGIFFSSDNRVTHNEIADLGYTGVSVGWEWSYRYSPTVRNIVEYNHIHHIGRGELSDMGGVYTLGISDGTSVSHNVIHDVVSYGYGGWGLYTDQASSYIRMCCNLVYRCKCGGFHQHFGRENVIENNIFAYSDLQQLDLTIAEEHQSFSFDRNIILQERGTTAKGPWGEADIDFGRNIFWTEGSPLLFGNSQGGTGLPESDIFMDYETFCKDIAPGCVNTDPLFEDPHGDDFRFRSLKSARKIGFIPFDFTEAGVYGADEWCEKARNVLY